MKKLFTPPLWLLTAILAVAWACNKEESVPDPVPEPNTPAKVGRVSVSLERGLDPSDEPETRSIVSIESEEFKDAYLFAFKTAGTKGVYTFVDGAGKLRPVATYTDSKTFDWDLPVGDGQRFDVLAVVNPGAAERAVLQRYLDSAATDITQGDFESMLYTCSSSMELLSVEKTGMPMSGGVKDCYLDGSNEELTISVKRLFARYELRFNMTKFIERGYMVDEIFVESGQSNTEVPYFYSGNGKGFRQTEASKLGVIDLSTESDVLAASTLDSENKSGSVVFYLPENCQGDIAGASKWTEVSSLGNTVEKCSYIFIRDIVKKKDGSTGWFRYRLYPGQEATMSKNFDVIRNRSLKMTISLNPDEAEKGDFIWDNDLIIVGPGEYFVAPFTTTRRADELSISVRDGNIVSNDIYESADEPYLENNRGEYLFRVKEDCPAGKVFQVRQLCCGNDSPHILNVRVRDLGTSSLTDNRYFASYSGEWSFFKLKDYVDSKYFNYYVMLDRLNSNGYYSSVDQLEVYDLSVDLFSNGKTDPDSYHIYYDHVTQNVFVYSPVGGDFRIRLCREQSFEHFDDATDISSFDYTLKTPVLGWVDYDPSSITGRLLSKDEHITVDLSSGVESFDYKILDPETEEEITVYRFEWARCFDPITRKFVAGFSNYVANDDFSSDVINYQRFFHETTIDLLSDDAWYDNTCVVKEHDTPPDPGHDGWRNAGTVEIMRNYDGPLDYSKDIYFSLESSFFINRPFFAHPTLDRVPQNAVWLMQASESSSSFIVVNDYDKMVVGSKVAPEEFHIAPGLKQTYFLRLENFTSTVLPEVKIKKNYNSMDNSPYDKAPLKYDITRVSSSVFRIDFYVDWSSDIYYEFDDVPQNPYKSDANERLDSRFIYDIEISHPSLPSDVKEITCHAHVYRSSVGFWYSDDYVPPEDQHGFLLYIPSLYSKMYMYNPYGFKFKVSVVASTEDYTGVAKPYITDIAPDHNGKCFMDGSIQETLWSYHNFNYIHIEKVGDNTYVGTPECPKSLSLDITLEMDEGFSSTVSGLSYNGTFTSRTIERYLDWSRSYSMGPIYFR